MRNVTQLKGNRTHIHNTSFSSQLKNRTNQPECYNKLSWKSLTATNARTYWTCVVNTVPVLQLFSAQPDREWSHPGISFLIFVYCDADLHYAQCYRVRWVFVTCFLVACYFDRPYYDLNVWSRCKLITPIMFLYKCLAGRA